MKDEVEEFLRRVAQMRASAEAQARGQQQRPTPQKPPPKPQRTAPASRLATPPQLARLSEPLPVEIVDAELADAGDRFGQRVRSDLRETEEIAEHTRHLGADVDAADNKMQAHLQHVFDHKLGQLKSTSVATALVVADRNAAELSLDHIRVMLASPQSVRDAIIMSEVLRRPDF
jgi:hypothetical protein